MTTSTELQRFRTAYGKHREREGRQLTSEEMSSLPFLTHGYLARQWAVKARTYLRFVKKTLPAVLEKRRPPLTILDVGSGNGWLSHRLARIGHRSIALDIRTDEIDGLGASRQYDEGGIHRLAGTFEHVPLATDAVDLTVFNAAIHYATDLAAVLSEAKRVTAPGGTVAIMDSPFYRRRAFGEAMVADKKATAGEFFGDLATDLMAIRSIEFLTEESLADASRGLQLHWRHHRVRYPLWYELRPLVAALKRKRPPSRFDLWEARVA